MPETTRVRQPDRADRRPSEHLGKEASDQVTERVRGARAGLVALLQEAEQARRRRAEVASAGEDAGTVCAWNHFENIPTFYNWNNRPR